MIRVNLISVALNFEAAVLRGCRGALSPILSPVVMNGTGVQAEPPPGSGPLLLALSGGADSTAMTAALAALRDNPETAGPALNLYALHVNHGIRPPDECAADEESAAALCELLGVPLSVKRVPPGQVEEYAGKHGTGMEAAARRFRHAALRDEARRTGAQAILTAHTRDDLLETILMAFLRGAGPAGLGAMRPAPERAVHYGTVRSGAAETKPPLVRPLLGLDRGAVLAYLAARGIPHREDSTNSDERFLRNRIRRRLVPLLDECFPRWRDPVRRLGETQALTAVFLAEEAARRLPREENAGPGFRFPAGAFFARPQILREAALFAAIDELNSPELDSPLMETKKPRLEALRRFASGEAKAQDLGPARLERRGGFVRVLPPLKRN